MPNVDKQEVQEINDAMIEELQERELSPEQIKKAQQFMSWVMEQPPENIFVVEEPDDAQTR